MKKDSLFIPYITAGFPLKKLFIPTLKLLSSEGADFIEVGVPHSDPLADGPVIQGASQVALKNGMTLKWIVETLNKVSPQKIKPLILFSYLNPILQYGFEKLLKDLPKTLFYGLIIPDLPFEEAKKYSKLFRKYNLELILLVAPNTPKKKIFQIAQISKGLIYLVSVAGVTGVRKNVSKELKQKLREVKSVTKTPVVIGFGISNKKQIQKVISYGADGVVIGSALIKVLNVKNNNLKRLKEFIKLLR